MMSSFIKKALIGTGIAGLAAVGYGVHFMQTEMAGVGLPWVSEVDLPDFPDYPTPKASLDVSDQGDIYFQTKSPYDLSVLLNDYANAKPTTGKGALHLPDNASADNPVPAIIILHGSGGIAPGREDRYAKFYNDLGVAAFILDYYAPRGARLDLPYTYKVLSTTEVDIIHDAIKALELLGTHPAIAGDRIGVTGYSYGGMVTRYLQDPRFKEIIAPNAPDFAAHIDTYGPCHQTMGSDKTTNAPYLALRGDQDNSIDLKVCEQTDTVMLAEGTPVEAHILEGAGHAWENDRPRVMGDHPYVTGCSFSFDAHGDPLVNDSPVFKASANATRGERAYARGMLMIEASKCLGKGYIGGKDDDADRKAKAIITDFIGRTLNSEQGYQVPEQQAAAL